MRYTLALVLTALAACGGEPDWRPAQAPLTTRWTEDVSPSSAHPEYPRPMLRREEWLNLNGLWQYAITARDSSPEAYQGEILVPFPIESALSGVADTVGPERRLWYHREFEVPRSWTDQRVLLHFEAVDWETQVWLNGHEVGRHRGGYDPFAFDITQALREGTQQLKVAVWDPTNAGTQPRGKQVREPGGIFYTSVTGIWGTVWLEPVPEVAIEDYRAVPDIDEQRVTVIVETTGTHGEDLIQVAALADGSVVTSADGAPGESLELTVQRPRLWSPDDPFLYDLAIRLLHEGQPVDSVHGYFGMRKVSIGEDERGVLRLLLNNEFVFQSGPLDQGYWPDGLYVAPTEEAMAYDLEMIKAMGFNMLRKHVKVEPRTFYSLCDRMGILIWQDMPNADIPLRSRGSDVPADPAATSQFETELRRLVVTHRNHPSIVMWVPFNEGWGQYDTRRIVELVRETDPTRLVNHASGWYDRGFGDVIDLHSYPAPNPPEPEAGRAAVLGEYGGLGFNVPGHTWTEEGWGYALFPDRESMTQRFEDYLEILLAAARDHGLSAAVYTQITDIETENNGLLTYDRQIAKIEPEAIALAHRGIFAPRVTNRTPIFVDEAMVEFLPSGPAGAIHYTTDGRDPTERSPRYDSGFTISESTVVKARTLREDGTASRVSTYRFEKTRPRSPVSVDERAPGLRFDYFESDSLWRRLPDFGTQTPASSAVSERIDHGVGDRGEYFGLYFRGFIDIPQTGVYGFYLTSDDGSHLLIDGQVVADNDGIHGARERSGFIALEAGLHSLELQFFQGAGGVALTLAFDGPGIEKQEIPSAMLFHD